MNKKSNKSVTIDFKKAIDKNALKKAFSNENSKREILNILNKIKY